jgi:exopolyphosphatase / guanosine-5'-triphosphate,3'-diphosphate pyrophosphatase
VATLIKAFSERIRLPDLEPLGVIDIGSNSVRLVVYEGAVRAAQPLFNEKILCGLGRAVSSTGNLGAESVSRALEALRRFRAISRTLRVKNLRAIATAAVRDASDGAGFIAQAERVCGTKIEILSGEKEAELAAQGIRMGFVEADGLAGDLGGGSLELIDIYKDQLNEAATLPLGGLRLIDQAGDRIDQALPAVDAAISGLAWLSKGEGRPFYAVGGTWRALAKLHMAHVGYPLRVMHGYSMTTREAIEFCQQVRRAKKLSSLPGIEDIARARREVLPYGALVLERLLSTLSPSEVIFSVFGIREGLLFSLMPPHERAKDPLIRACEDFAVLRSRSLAHARELFAWTDMLFEGDGPRETPEERRLRHAACLISDIGWRTHPDYRGEQSLNLVAHAGMAGIDHPGRIFLALSIFYRHTGQDRDSGDFSARLKSAVSKRAQKRARIIGAAVRTAHMLSVGMPGVIDETVLCYEGDKLVLSLPKVHASLDGERLRRRLTALATLLGRQPELRVPR